MIRHHPGLRAVLIAVHFGWSLAVYHRPHAPLILQSYKAFEDFMPWPAWGWSALVIGLLLLRTRPGTLLAQFASLLSSVFFFAVVAAVGRGVGITTGVTTYSVLAFASLALFALDFQVWFARLGWVKRLVSRPPRWFRGPDDRG